MMETVQPLQLPCGFKPQTDKMSKISVMKLDLFYLRYLLDDNSNKCITKTLLACKLGIFGSYFV
jgi:hypothetical protein